MRQVPRGIGRMHVRAHRLSTGHRGNGFDRLGFVHARAEVGEVPADLEKDRFVGRGVCAQQQARSCESPRLRAQGARRGIEVQGGAT